MEPIPAISVIISVHDHDCLDKNLYALASQSMHPSEFEVLVVDADHAVDSEAVVRQALESDASILNLKYINMPKGGRSSAWNRGVRESSADLILFLSDDFIASPDLLKRHVTEHRNDPRDELVALGPGLFPPDLKITHFMLWMEQSGELFGTVFFNNDDIPQSFFYGANVSMKRNFLCATGLYDERFPYDGWEDYELGERLLSRGMVIKYLPGAIAYHYHTYSFEDRYKVMIKAGESAAIYDSIYSRHRPWQKYCKYPSWLFGAAAWVLFLKHFLSRSPRDIERYWWLSLRQGFVAGYRKSIKAR